MPRAAVGLGSNLGDRLGNLRAALRRLDEKYPIVAVSSLYLTEPIGGPDQDEFLNAVALVESGGAPADLLGHLHAIEDEAGRIRDEHWGPRTLDLDLISVEGVECDTPELILPHPRAHLRRFVVAPLAEVWPEARLEGGKAEDYLKELIDQKAVRLASVWKDDHLQFLDRGGGWVVGQALLILAIGALLVVTGSWPTGWRWLGLFLILGAAFLMLRSAAALGPALTPYPAPRQGELAQRGVYRGIRHPMYAGVVLLFLGAAVLVGSIAALALGLAAAVFFWLKGAYEEKRLRIVYPGYDEYRKKVRGRLVPGLW